MPKAFAALMRWFGAATANVAAPVANPPTVSPMPEEAKLAMSEGLAHFQSGAFELAACAFARALECKHDLAEAHFFLGLTHRKRGQLEDAADCLLMATSFKADFADAWFYLGDVDRARGRHADAKRSFDAALRLNPGHAEAHAACAKLCEEQKKFGAALEHWRAVATAKPDHAVAYCNLGRLTLRESLDDARALDYVRQALALQPRLAEAHSCHAQILQFQGNCREAIAACDIALQIDPAAYHTRMIRALALLSAGEFEAGWRDYEERKRVYPVYAVRKLPYPEWDGSSLAGKRLLIYHEQGLGDEIMFASCFADVLRSGAQCVIECSARLEAIFSRAFPAARIVVANQTSPDLSHLTALPACDFQVAAGSLPRFFRRRATEFPDAGAYLFADPEATARWRMRLQSLGTGLNIGVSWRGGAAHTNQANRSIRLDAMLPLLSTPGCKFICLQYGTHAEDLATLNSEHGATVHCWPEALASFDETAALVGALDLVITVATTVAHLASALDKPTWVMVPSSAEWRYMASGSSMPWYPRMRIFRRGIGAGWEPTVAQLAAELVNWHGIRQAGS